MPAWTPDGLPDAPVAPARERAWAGWVTAALDLAFPPFCPVCRERLGPGRRDPLCGRCWSRIPRIVPPICRVCGLPVGQALGAGPDSAFGPAASSSPPADPGTGRWCGACRARPVVYAYARAAAPFGEVMREALHALKFGKRRAVARPLGDLLAEAGSACPAARRADLLVPVPLHRDRERERGFNQAALLADRLARAWEMPVAPTVLVRTTPTLPQSGLGREERRRNVRGAFAVARPRRVTGRRVVLVDDVMTTGATAEACAVALRRAGAVEVGVLTVTRALG